MAGAFKSFPKQLSDWLRFESAQEYTRGYGNLAANSGDLVTGAILKDTAGVYTVVDPATVANTDKLVILLQDTPASTAIQSVAVVENGPATVIGAELGYNGADSAKQAIINTALKAALFKFA